jgi:hypothetical protein
VAITDADSDIPRIARKFLSSVQEHESELRAQIKQRLQMYVGGPLQWDEKERARRDAAHRPYISINECKPPIDQVETDIRLNPPGPICHPVGNGAEAETADIIAGLIRGTEYRSEAKASYVTAGKHSAISGYGVIEYGTRYVDDRTADQELFVIENEDPSMWYFDPLARKPNRQDSMMALKGPRILSREAYILEYGENRKVLNRGYVESFAGNVQQMFGWAGNYATMNTWTSGGRGPYWVAEFWRVEVSTEKSRQYTDLVWRKDSELKGHPLPAGVTVRKDDDGDSAPYIRSVPSRVVKKHVVDACEVLDETEWIGDHIPALAVLGPEIYIDGKLHRGSLVAGMIDPQKALNYTATSMMEIAGKVPKAPFIGTKGQFDDIGDDGRNKWETATSTDHAWLAVEPVQMVDEVSGRAIFAPLPQRNMMEASIQWLLGLAGFFKDAIQAASAYSATSLGKRTADQSGEAIKALQAESNKGTFSYPDGVNSAVAVMYQQWLDIFPRIMDSARAETIIQADGQHEQALINQFFDHPGGEKAHDGKLKQKIHDIRIGRYSVRVDAGPSLETRNQAALGNLDNLFKAAPQLLQIPGVAASYARLLGDGNPRVEQIADMLPGGDNNAEQNPQQIQQQNQQLQAQNQQLQQAVQQMHQAIEAQLPKIEADKFKALLSSLTSIRVAEISASKDFDNAKGDREASLLEKALGFAHDTAKQAVDQEHQAGMADKAQDAEQQQAQNPDQQQEQPKAPGHGQRVMLRNGKRGTVSAIHPDGSFDVEEGA